MYPNVGYQMDWNEIDECIDSTPSCFLGYDDYMDEIDCPYRLNGFTNPVPVWDRRNGKLFVSVAMG